ncbi:MAG: hypothetical protein AAF497_24895 [Planctomycetota bacterium]
MERFFLNPAVVWVLIPISYFIVTGISEIYSRYCIHQERIAMIENGMHPDTEPDPYPESDPLQETAPYQRHSA